ncbi:branched-chain amino acid ABC transporter permease [Aquabacter spiritensis]|uniref:Amino acid/amide ABC transporter membrane protein 1 (HAAT family) n=1 Tax=Aquabacter spiritensis TaxID=933073 RepID=A0A4R3LXW5_9HYPH|nr:branched-chain amino acid ABC transporter permease [Aquabacter spiritensis]TCT05462.1 amino acid/amide ABC transporter membrane protein 1 (HAAT family) [Aquabacter spiritensis]
MTLILQQLVEGLASGTIYAALAVALVMIHRATRIVNFAQGEMATFCVYLAWQMTVWGLPLYVALAIAAVLSFILGAAVFRLAIRPILSAPPEAIVVSCIGLFIGFQAMSLWLWGSDNLQFPRLFSNTIWTIADVRISANTAGMLVTLALLAGLLAAMFRFTRIGLAMRAAAAEREKSPYVGIEVETMLTLGWGLAAVFGFIAAVLAAPSLFLSPTMMLSVIIYALAAATLGGWDSPAGAIVGGLVVGVAETLGTTLVKAIGAELRLAIPFLLITLILFVRPQGLFGRSGTTRV